MSFILHHIDLIGMRITGIVKRRLRKHAHAIISHYQTWYDVHQVQQGSCARYPTVAMITLCLVKTAIIVVFLEKVITLGN